MLTSGVRGFVTISTLLVCLGASDALAIATEAIAHGVEGVGAPATLTVQRNLLSNPLDESCGAGFDVTVTPSAAQVDRDLPIPRYWKLR